MSTLTHMHAARWTPRRTSAATRRHFFDALTEAERRGIGIGGEALLDVVQDAYSGSTVLTQAVAAKRPKVARDATRAYFLYDSLDDWLGGAAPPSLAAEWEKLLAINVDELATGAYTFNGVDSQIDLGNLTALDPRSGIDSFACSASKVVNEFGIEMEPGAVFQAALPSNWNPDSFEIGGFVRADFANNDGLQRRILTLYADSNNYVLFQKTSTNTLQATVRVGGVEHTATIAAGSLSFSAGHIIYLGVSKPAGGVVTVHYASQGAVSITTAASGTTPAGFGALSWTGYVGHDTNQTSNWDGNFNLFITRAGATTPITDRFNAGSGQAIATWLTAHQTNLVALLDGHVRSGEPWARASIRTYATGAITYVTPSKAQQPSCFAFVGQFTYTALSRWLFSRWNVAGSQKQFGLYVGGTATFQAYCSADGSAQASGAGNTVLVSGTRYQVAVLYNGRGIANADRLKLYVRAYDPATGLWGSWTAQTVTFTGTIPGSLYIPTVSTAAYFGRSVDGNYWSGSISDGRLWVDPDGSGSVPTEAQLQAQAESDTAPSPQPDFWWPMNGGATDAVSKTITRATTATRRKVDGVYEEVASGVLREGHIIADPMSGAFLNATLLEASTVNRIPNPRLEGAVVGTPGTAPTTWAFPGSVVLSRQIVAVGTEYGLPYVDVRIFGTADAANYLIAFDSWSGSAFAAVGETWTRSCRVRRVAGSMSNITRVSLEQRETTAAGGNLGTTAVGNDIDVESTARVVRTGTLSNASVQRVVSELRIVATNGTAIDITLRISGPQLEKQPTATSLMLPPVASPGASTRNADVLSFTEFASPQASTWVLDAIDLGTFLSGGARYFSLGDSTAGANRLQVYVSGSSILAQLVVNGVGVGSSTVSTAGIAVGSRVRLRVVLTATTIQLFLSVNGAAETAGTTGALTDALPSFWTGLAYVNSVGSGSQGLLGVLAFKGQPGTVALTNMLAERGILLHYESGSPTAVVNGTPSVNTTQVADGRLRALWSVSSSTTNAFLAVAIGSDRKVNLLAKNDAGTSLGIVSASAVPVGWQDINIRKVGSDVAFYAGATLLTTLTLTGAFSGIDRETWGALRTPTQNIHIATGSLAADLSMTAALDANDRQRLRRWLRRRYVYS